MLTHVFYGKVYDEESALNFLRSHGIFDEETMPCPGVRGRVCEGFMKRKFIVTKGNTKTPVWKCGKKNCRTTRSIRSTNAFFTYRTGMGNATCNLQLKSILILLYEWLYSTHTIDVLQVRTGICRGSIVDWLNLFREVCTSFLKDEPLYAGVADDPIQIDESYFSGRRKNNVGRLQVGNIRSSNESQERAQEEVDSGNTLPTTPDRNMGGQVVGPWVFGIYESARRVRFFVIPDRKGTTLIPLIADHCEFGSVIVSDQWSGYSRLEENGYWHQTVNHSRNFVDPVSGYHTQAIERVWQEGKAWIRRARGGGPMLQSHLDEVSWRLRHRNGNISLMEAFLRDVKKYYTTDLEGYFK